MDRRRRSTLRGEGGVVAELGEAASPIVRPWVDPDEADEENNADKIRQTDAPPPIPFRPPLPPDPEPEGLPRLVIEGDPTSSGDVRVYHRSVTADRLDPQWCWAFTISRESAESVINDGPLLASGASYPDGTPCVPAGSSPYDVEVRCGTCRAKGLDHVALRLIAR